MIRRHPTYATEVDTIAAVLNIAALTGPADEMTNLLHAAVDYADLNGFGSVNDDAFVVLGDTSTDTCVMRPDRAMTELEACWLLAIITVAANLRGQQLPRPSVRRFQLDVLMIPASPAWIRDGIPADDRPACYGLTLREAVTL